MSFFSYSGHKLWYEERGNGPALVLLHGSAMSSRLFGPLIPLYERHFRVICLDFLGHGRSDRLSRFEDGFWQDEGKQIIALIKHLQLPCANLLGTGGGAVAALNAAFAEPALVRSVIADALEGERSLQGEESVRLHRASLKLNGRASAIWRFIHGDDWASVVDNDTDMLLRHIRAGGAFFPRGLEELSVPALYTALRHDPVIPGAEDTALALAGKTPKGRAYIFTSGDHPALISNAQEFSEAAEAFIGSI